MDTINIYLNGKLKEISSQGTIGELLIKLNLPEEGIVVEHNKEVVPRENIARTHVQDGDRLEIVQFIGGG